MESAIAPKMLHASLKKTKAYTPIIDLVGEEALQKAAGFLGNKFENTKTLCRATLAGDNISNDAGKGKE